VLTILCCIFCFNGTKINYSESGLDFKAGPKRQLNESNSEKKTWIAYTRSERTSFEMANIPEGANFSIFFPQLSPIFSSISIFHTAFFMV